MIAPGRGRWERHLTRDSRHALQRRRILDALPAVIAECGNAFTVDDVIAAAGMGRNTFYVHFDDTDAATSALLEETRAALSAALEGASSAKRTPIDRIRAVAAAWADVAATTPAFALVAYAEAPDDGVNAELREHLVSALDEARKAGIVSRNEDALRVTFVLGAFTVAAARVAAEPSSASATAEALVDLVLRVLR
jgi:AcrR family transcriptional regulator